MDYHSKMMCEEKIGNMAIPIKTNVGGGSAKVRTEDVELANDQDIIDEALYYFKSNVFFGHYETKGESDRLLIYLTLYIVSECLKKMAKCADKNPGAKEMYTLAVSKFDIPGDAAWLPL